MRVCKAEVMMMLLKWHSWLRLAEVAQLAQLAGWLPLGRTQMPINCPADDTLGHHMHKHTRTDTHTHTQKLNQQVHLHKFA